MFLSYIPGQLQALHQQQKFHSHCYESVNRKNEFWTIAIKVEKLRSVALIPKKRKKHAFLQILLFHASLEATGGSQSRLFSSFVTSEHQVNQSRTVSIFKLKKRDLVISKWHFIQNDSSVPFQLLLFFSCHLFLPSLVAADNKNANIYTPVQVMRYNNYL